jgi:hypothetical protein
MSARMNEAILASPRRRERHFRFVVNIPMWRPKRTHAATREPWEDPFPTNLASASSPRSTWSCVISVRSDRARWAVAIASAMKGFDKFSAPICRAVAWLYPARIAALVAFISVRYSLTNADCFGVSPYLAMETTPVWVETSRIVTLPATPNHLYFEGGMLWWAVRLIDRLAFPATDALRHEPKFTRRLQYVTMSDTYRRLPCQEL